MLFVKTQLNKRRAISVNLLQEYILQIGEAKKKAAWFPGQPFN